MEGNASFYNSNPARLWVWKKEHGKCIGRRGERLGSKNRRSVRRKWFNCGHEAGVFDACA